MAVLEKADVHGRSYTAGETSNRAHYKEFATYVGQLLDEYIMDKANVKQSTVWEISHKHFLDSMGIVQAPLRPIRSLRLKVILNYTCRFCGNELLENY